MGNDEMGRKDFLKYFFSKTVSLTAKVTEDFLEPLRQAGNTAEKILTTPLLPLEEFNNTPKLLSAVKPPIYIVGDKEKEIYAVSALCKNDGFLLTYLPQEEVLLCQICGAKYSAIELAVIPLSIKEGYIYK